MNLSEIKKKYRDILQQSDDSSNSDLDDSFDQALHVVQTKHRRTQSVANKQNSIPKEKKQINLHTQIIQLKERLGQANQRIEHKNTQLKNQYQRKSEINEEKKVLQKHLQSYQEQLDKKDKQLIELKATRIGFETRLKQLQEQFIDKDLDKQLLKKQIGFYQIEQKKFKQIIKDKDDQIKLLIAKNKHTRTMQSENQRLKKDINRLVSLLQDKKVFKSTKKFNMSYLGKSTCQSQNWYNRQVITVAQTFLKRHKILQKGILTSLVKLLQNIKKDPIRNKSVSQKHQSKDKRNSSLTYKDISIILPKNHSKSKNCPTTSIYQSLLHSKSKIKSVHKDTIQEQEKMFNCRQIVREYKTSMDELLEKKVCSKAKLRKLTQWLTLSFDNLIKDEYISFQ